jgi:hypothetical protein
MTEILELLEHVVQKQSVTRRFRVGSTGGGFGSVPPIDLDALEAKDRLKAAEAWHRADLELATERALELVERPARVPLGACPACGENVAAEFDRVSTQCGGCGDWVHVADAVAAARAYVEATWLTPAEIEVETRGWGSPVRAGRVRLWRHRGQISADARGRYLLADVLAELDRQAAVAA